MPAPSPELQLIYLFVHLVNAGSFSAAARQLDMPVATVSRKLARLEEQLNRQLLMRSTRKLRLTEEGLALFQKYQEVVSQFDALSHSGSPEKPEGTLRLAAPISIIANLLIGTLTEFCEQYPEIQLHIAQSNEEFDLVDKAIDVAIVGGTQPDSSWISCSLGVLDYRMVASPGYLRKAPALQHPQQLHRHKIIKAWPFFNWTLRHADGDAFYYDGPANLTLTDLNGAIRAAELGGGILYGPELFVKQQLQQGTLQVLLPEWRGEKRRISLLYHQRGQQPLKVRLFIEFMQARAAKLFAMNDAES
ncbi:LysR family transcriptional regulator [Shewanella yunxiaonensis]|uniref:LysR family transcriptional regulator n=1 Tax=Shewanella yunxiaonensis TaxID=2829809 RepID=A0ABX7YQ24_9GAMM|nr:MULTISPECIES: LysR family transcriptional regulator [Shewanella]MDF0534535.1 LysR family transcriptional regulator [Shewanella sp. A32]QUN04842.1 LysR family transcriptional regulator [Shewanella yunxiaonensis]